MTTNTEKNMSENNLPKIIAVPNLDGPEMSHVAARLLPGTRVTGHGIGGSDLIAALMFSTASEFKDDPRRHYLDADRIDYIRTVLAEANIDVNRSIAIALGREVAA